MRKIYDFVMVVWELSEYDLIIYILLLFAGSDRVGTTSPQISDVASYTCKETTSNINHTTQLFIYCKYYTSKVDSGLLLHGNTYPWDTC